MQGWDPKGIAGFITICFTIVFSGAMAQPDLVYADKHEWEEHGEKRNFPERHHHNDHENEHFSDRREKGNEATGIGALVLLLAANSTVLMSLLIKFINKFNILSLDIKEMLGRFNRFQKEHFRWTHYFLNPAALCLGFIHFGLSSCQTTALPESGLLLMALLMCMGLSIKLKAVPASARRLVLRLHTHPLASIVMIAFLIAGHAAGD